MSGYDLTQYVDRIYGYAIKKVYSREEADELSQEILFTVIKQLPTLKDEKRFEPWLWGIANNVTRAYRRQKGKEREVYVYDSVDESLYYDDYGFEQSNLCEEIRKQLAMLSATYREIIILHYYDNLSCKEIAKQLNLSEGTVMWRLSEGRKKLKKGCNSMLETVLKPTRLDIKIRGWGNYNGKDIPFPQVFISDALSQNILYQSYETPRTVEDLAKLCGVPAYYIEGCVANLVDREAIVEVKKGKYQTNFIIINKEAVQRLEQFKDEDIAECIIDTLKALIKEVMMIDFYKGGKSEEDLIYILGAVAIRYLASTNNPYPPVPHPVRYDGNKWSYHACVQGSPSEVFGIQEVQVGLSKLSYVSYKFMENTDREMLSGDEISMCGEIIRGSVETTDSLDKERVACLIKKGYITKAIEGNLKVNIPYLTLDQKHHFYKLVEKHFAPIMPLLHKSIEKYAEEYKVLVPRHLVDDRERLCSGLMMRVFTNAMGYGKEQGLLEKPQLKSKCGMFMEIEKTVHSI